MDVVKVRMQAASNKMIYPSTYSAYSSIFKKEGITGLWKGYSANLIRNSLINTAELVCYDTFKDILIKYNLLKDGLCCHFTAAFGAGFTATVVASPIDVIKTRLMNSQQKLTAIQCSKELWSEGGFSAFYKG